MGRPSEQAPTGRDAKGRLVKGASGNPGGRPKEYRAFKERCSEFMDAEGFELLTTMARQPNEFALRLMAEYAYGKPQQHVDVTSQGETIKAYVGVDLEKV